MERKECKGCMFRGKTGAESSCDFMFATGIPRGCPPGKGCTRKVAGKKSKKRNEISVRDYSGGGIAARDSRACGKGV